MKSKRYDKNSTCLLSSKKTQEIETKISERTSALLFFLNSFLMESLEVEMFRDTNGFLVEALEKAIGDKKPQEGQRLGDKFPHLTSELVQQVDQLRLIIKGLRSENGHRRSFSDSQSARAEGVAHCNAEAEIESLLPAYDGDRDALLRDCEETEARLVEVIDRKAA